MRESRRGCATFEPLEERLLLAADWTVLVYVDGDNNLEGAAIRDVNEMERVGSTAAVNVAVELDRISGEDNSNGNWTDTRRGLIVKDSNTTTMSSLPVGTGIGEMNMGDPATLTAFIQWGVGTYPAAHYALVLWDHGGGTSGVCWDDTSNDHLTLSEVGQAVGAAEAGAGMHFDLVGFDACMMGMLETAYQLRTEADVVVGSEQTEPWDGWPYDTVLADLVATPAQDAATLAASIVTRYGESYNGAETMSAATTAGVTTLAGAVDDLADAVIAQNTNWSAISAARTAASYFTETDFRDLGTFLSGVAANATNVPIQTAAQNALTAYGAAVIANHSGPGQGATGLSVYLPAQGGTMASDYTAGNFALAADTSWDEFLAELTGSSGGGGADTNGTMASATGVGALPATITGNVGLDGAQDVGGRDVDFYALTVSAGQRVGFDVDAKEQGGSLDGMLRLFDNTGTQLALSDDAFDPDTNAYSFDPYLEYRFTKSGTVYIAVSGYHNSSYNPAAAGSGVSGSTGAYTLRIRDLNAAPDVNGTIATATALGSAPTTYSGAIGDESIGGKDVDFYAVQVESGQQLTISASAAGSGLDAYLRLFTGSGTLLASDDNTNGVDPEITYDFSAAGAGTYYVGVSGSPNNAYDPFTAGSGVAGSTGSYVLSVAGSSTHLDFNGTIPRATALGALPATVSAQIGDEPIGVLDVDFYSVSVSAGDTVGFDIDADESGSPLDAVLRLFSPAGSELALSDSGTDPDSGFTGHDPYLRYTFATAGVYYIAVSGGPNDAYEPFVEASGVNGSTGAYSLLVRRIGTGSDVNGTLATATTAAVPATISAEIGDEPAGDLDVDIYSFSVLAGQTLAFNIDAWQNGSTLDSVLRLFNSAGDEIGYDDDAVDPNNGLWSRDSYLTHTFTAPGTYYIGVSGYGNADYDPTTALSGAAGYTGEYGLDISLLRDNSVDLSGVITDSALPAQVIPNDKRAGRIKSLPLVLTNNGNGRVKGHTTIDLYASTNASLEPGQDTLIATLNASLSIRGGQTKSLSFRNVIAPTLTPADYYLLADIDPANTIPESDESNNLAASVHTVQWLAPRSRAAAPDVAGQITASKLPAYVVPGDRKAGTLKSVPVLITNLGDAPAVGTVAIDLYASADTSLDQGAHTYLATINPVLNLAPGRSRSFAFSKVSVPPLDPGNYYLLADIDSGTALGESNELNNLAVSPGTIAWDSLLLQRGIDLPLYDQSVDLKALRSSLNRAKSDGVTWVAVNVFWFQNDVNSTAIAPDFTKYSASDASVAAAIDQAQRLGLAVMLRPLVDFANDPSHWRGQIAGTSAWFNDPQGYDAFINHFADLAQQHNVELFCVGSELGGSQSREADWRSLIAGVRSRFTGSLVYSANHGGASQVLDAELAWWDALDYIGIDAYYPLTNDNNPSAADLAAKWVQRADNIQSWWNALDPADRKPIIFTEIGYRSWDSTNRHPWDTSDPNSADLDPQEQADCYAAVFDSVWKQRTWLSGLYWWNWDVNPASSTPDWFSPQGKPAESVLRAHYALGG